MKKKLVLIIILTGVFSAYGQNNRYRLTSNSAGFSYSFIKPNEWILDSTNAANYLAHVAIYKNKVDYDKGGLIIQILAFEKKDEKTNEDLDYDVNSYKARFSNLKQKEFPISHSVYTTYSKKVYVENSFYQYIIYINPGPKFKFGISAALNTNEKDVDKSDLELFKEIVKSIVVDK